MVSRKQKQTTAAGSIILVEILKHYCAELLLQTQNVVAEVIIGSDYVHHEAGFECI
jgi:hypothetical protein